MSWPYSVTYVLASDPLARNRGPADICLAAYMTGNLLKQPAPGNVSTRVRFFGTTPGRTIPGRNYGPNIARGNFREPLFNTVFGLSRNGEHITRSSGTSQSGLPDVASRSPDD